MISAHSSISQLGFLRGTGASGNSMSSSAAISSNSSLRQNNCNGGRSRSPSMLDRKISFIEFVSFGVQRKGMKGTGGRWSAFRCRNHTGAVPVGKCVALSVISHPFAEAE